MVFLYHLKKDSAVRQVYKRYKISIHCNYFCVILSESEGSRDKRSFASLRMTIKRDNNSITRGFSSGIKKELLKRFL